MHRFVYSKNHQFVGSLQPCELRIFRKYNHSKLWILIPVRIQILPGFNQPKGCFPVQFQGTVPRYKVYVNNAFGDLEGMQPFSQ